MKNKTAVTPIPTNNKEWTAERKTIVSPCEALDSASVANEKSPDPFESGLLNKILAVSRRATPDKQIRSGGCATTQPARPGKKSDSSDRCGMTFSHEEQNRSDATTHQQQRMDRGAEKNRLPV